jgi:hypothetical protein
MIGSETRWGVVGIGREFKQGGSVIKSLMGFINIVKKGGPIQIDAKLLSLSGIVGAQMSMDRMKCLVENLLLELYIGLSVAIYQVSLDHYGE